MSMSRQLTTSLSPSRRSTIIRRSSPAERIRDALKAAGLRMARPKFVYRERPKGDPDAATQIARRFANSKPDVIVPISTPSALPSSGRRSESGGVRGCH